MLRAELVFYNFRSNYEKKERLAVPMVAIASSHELFDVVIRSWIAEDSEGRPARRAFVSTLIDEGVLKLSDVREVVTLLEMKAREKFKPISLLDFSELRSRLRSVVVEQIQFLNNGGLQADGLLVIRNGLDNLNSKDARPAIQGLIEIIPLNFRSEIITDPKILASEIIDLRSDVTHDLGRLTNRSYQLASKVIHVFRWTYAVLDVMDIGVLPVNLKAHYAFYRLAVRVDETLWRRE